MEEKLIELKKYIINGFKWYKKHYNEEYLFIDNLYSIPIRWAEKYYLYLNSLSSIPLCYCGKETKFTSINKGFRTFCSSKCACNSDLVKDKIKKTISEFSEEKILNTKNKIKNVFLEKYGVDNPSKLSVTKEKVKKTNLEKFGCEYITQTNRVRKSLSEKLKTRQVELQYLQRNRLDAYWKSKLEKYGFEFIDMQKNILTIKCRLGHIFKIPRVSLNDRVKYNCEVCTICNKFIHSEKLITDNKQFIERAKIIHGNKYVYLSEYIKSKEKITIQCNKCNNIFSQTPSSHLSGSGCSKCCSNVSYKEVKWLDSLNIMEENRQICLIIDGKKYNLDAKVGNTIYEFYGDYWHGNPNVYDSNKINKTLNKTFGELYKKTLNRQFYLEDKGYNVVSVWEDEFDEIIINI